MTIDSDSSARSGRGQPNRLADACDLAADDRDRVALRHQARLVRLQTQDGGRVDRLGDGGRSTRRPGQERTVANPKVSPPEKACTPNVWLIALAAGRVSRSRTSPSFGRLEGTIRRNRSART